MPTYAQSIREQRLFEEPRGLQEFNTIAFGLLRCQEELLEAQYEAYKGNLEALLTEVIDVTIFAHSIIGRLCEELGLAPEQVDTMVEQKFAHNHHKYDERFWIGRQTSDAIKTARHWHNNGIVQDIGNDYY